MDNEPDSSPAGNALREEVGLIMADPEWGRNKALEAKVDKLYKDKYGEGKVDLSEGLTVGGLDEEQHPGSTEDAGVASPEEAEARARSDVILAPLRDEWGEQYETNFALARGEACELFIGHEGIFKEVADRIAECGPKGETVALKFLAELAQLRKEGG
ncbi:hypothetical protein MYX04_05740 [Nitrospiraceae bacterium AH_259_D15_M11_P09]|nr:hypothetical protein [Nitrospiraceae bacterium AH_259_D15_M11_P09]